jgi:dTDP-glucose 4,6-dehydratase
MIINAMSDKPLPVYGDGGNVRDWLHVDDHCAAIDLVLHRGRDGEIYNIGGNTELKNIDVVRLIIKNLGKPDSLISFVKDRPGHDRRYAIDASKIEGDLGWRPRRTFDEGIVETIEWYRTNETWWKRIISGEYQQYYKQVYENRM